MSDDSIEPAGLRIGHVRGVTVTKWRRTWEQRFRDPIRVEEVADSEQLTGLRDGSLDMCFVRLPIDRDGLHAIPLYEEQMVAWVAKDHAVAAADEVTRAELKELDDTILTELDAIAIDRVLAGAVLVVPMSVARSASRRDLTFRPVADAETSPVALAWRVDDPNPLLDEFVGVVRGRSADSSRTERERRQSGTRPAAARPRQQGKQRPKKVRRGH